MFNYITNGVVREETLPTNPFGIVDDRPADAAMVLFVGDELPPVTFITWPNSVIIEAGTVSAPAFDAALMAAMVRPWPDIVFALPRVVASGMMPPNIVRP